MRKLNKKGLDMSFEKIVLIIIALFVLIAILFFTKGKLQKLIDNFFSLIKGRFI